MAAHAGGHPLPAHGDDCMDTRFKTLALAGLFGLMSIGQAQASSLDSMKDKAGDMLSGGGSGEGTSLLSTLSSGSFNPGSLTNLTGVISYCQENGYLGSTADVAKNQVMEQLGVSSEPTDDSDYQQGLSGILQGEDQTFNLASLGDQVGEKACGMVADKAMSFVGG
ncbi:DUF2501 domain-containing protein [Halomonas elongata]|nr:DUF2501 domain-containing protein [Halomonas elongata]